MLTRTTLKSRILVADDDLALVETLCEGLGDFGYEAHGTGSSRAAAGLLETQAFDALVTDLRMPGMAGLGLLAFSQKLARERPVIVMTAYSAVDMAIEAIRRGAYHYLTKPFSVGELALFLERALAQSCLLREMRVLQDALEARESDLTCAAEHATRATSATPFPTEVDAPLEAVGSTSELGRRASGPELKGACQLAERIKALLGQETPHENYELRVARSLAASLSDQLVELERSLRQGSLATLSPP